ncbi:hypothetical protein [Nitrosomonas communis]|uniref:hypothetical protein n=1 Tax=Nitrosomonas communis TaxID=44574 RepID=UPI003D2CB0DA
MTTTDSLALFLGWIVISSGIAMTGLLLAFGLFYALNKLLKEMVSYFYSWKYYLEFVDWYHENKKPKTKNHDN